MNTRRVLSAFWLVMLLGGSSVQGEAVPFAEPTKAGDCVRIELQMDLQGKMQIKRGDRTVDLPLEAHANHTYAERILSVGKDGTISRSARHYEVAQIRVHRGVYKTQHTLRSQRKLVVAQRYKGKFQVYSPVGALDHSELNLVGKHFDTLAVPAVLPSDKVKESDTWKVPSQVVEAFCAFEGVTKQDVTGKVDRITATEIAFSLEGKATGIELGALIQADIQATGRFDRKTHRLTSLVWTQKNKRDQGPASPASSYEVKITLKRQSIEQPKQLSDVALVAVPDGMTPPRTMLYMNYRDPKNRFALLYDRAWQITTQTKEHVVLRLMDRGTWIADATITPWTRASKGKHLSPESFKDLMNETRGWEPLKELQAGELPAGETGRWIYRMAYLGNLDGIPVLQTFYLIANASGEQVVVVFTMKPKQADKFGASDLELVSNLAVPAPSPESEDDKVTR